MVSEGKVLFALLCGRNCKFTEMDPLKSLYCERVFIEAALYEDEVVCPVCSVS